MGALVEGVICAEGEGVPWEEQEEPGDLEEGAGVGWDARAEDEPW